MEKSVLFAMVIAYSKRLHGCGYVLETALHWKGILHFELLIPVWAVVNECILTFFFYKIPGKTQHQFLFI